METRTNCYIDKQSRAWYYVDMDKQTSDTHCCDGQIFGKEIHSQECTALRCSNCKSLITNPIEVEFYKETGECLTCDNVRADAIYESVGEV